MSAVSINLDEIVGEDTEFILHGNSYFIPADIPSESMVRMMNTWKRAKEAEDEDAEVAALADVYHRILELFQIRKPELRSSFDLSELEEAGEITAEERATIPELVIGMAQIGAVMGAIDSAYNDAPAEEEEAAPVPLARRKPSASGSGSSRSKKPSAGARKTGARRAGGS